MIFVSDEKNTFSIFIYKSETVVFFL